MSKADRSTNPSPGDKRGDPANVIGKTLDSIVKSGRSAVVEILSPGQHPIKCDLIYATTPVGGFICGTQQVASRIAVQMFIIDHGTLYDLMAVLAIKMTIHTELTSRWFDPMDINAGTIVTGEGIIENVSLKLFESILDVAGGREKTFSDQWELHNQPAMLNLAPVT